MLIFYELLFINLPIITDKTMVFKRIILPVIMMMFFYHPDIVSAQDSSDSTILVTDTVYQENDSLIAMSDSTQSHVIRDYFLRKDSLDVYTYSFFKDSINYHNYEYIDTANHTVGEYNPVNTFKVAYNDLGIIGSAQENQVFSPSAASGFKVGFNHFRAYYITPKDIIFYQTRTPYSKVFYVMGAVKENILKVNHAQSFLDEQLHASIDFDLFNHLGAYTHQHTDVKRFNGGIGYRTKNARYHALAQYYISKQKLEENGGIINLNEFEENIESNRQIYKTYLATAENLVKKSGVVLQQAFYLSKPEPDFSGIPDTNILQFEGYSVTHFKKPYFDPVSHLGQIKYNFNYEQESFRYTDQDQNSKIYDGLPIYPGFDKVNFFDSISNRSFINEITYSNSDYKDWYQTPKFLNYFFGARHEYNEYSQDSIKRVFVHYALIGGAFLNLSNSLSVLADAQYYIGDYLNNDLSFNGKAFFKMKSHLFTAGINLSHRTPDWIYHSYSSLRFMWNNDFAKTDIQKLFFKYHYKRFDFEFQLMNINDYVFFNQQILPQQFDENIQHIIVRAEKDFRIGPWGTDIMFIYQNVSHSDIVRVPDLSAKMKVFYKNMLFNSALDLEIGVEASYFTAYYADKYMPALRSFHLQDEQLIGDYPYLDVYLNAKIGKARLFVRYDHFNAGLMGYTYYASPDYPAQDAAFRFGVSWILFN